MAEPARQNYDDDYSPEPVTRPNLHALEGGGETSEPKRGHLKPVSDEDSPDNLSELEAGEAGDDDTDKAETEESKALSNTVGEPATEEGGLYRQEGGSAASKKSKKGGKAKKLALISAGGGGLLVAIILVLMIALSSFKIIHLAENIGAYTMARQARAWRQSVSQASEEQVSTQTMSDAEAKGFIGKYGSKFKDYFAKYDKFRPAKLYKQLKADVNPVFEDGPKRSILGGQQKIFKGYEIDGHLLAAQDTKWYTPFKNRTERLRFSADLDAILEQKYHASNSLVRSSVMKKFLEEKGITLHWWEKKGSKYQGLKQDAAERLAQKDALEHVDNARAEGCKVADVCNGSKNARDKVKESVNQGVDSPEAAAAGEGAAGVENKAADAAATEIESAVGESIFKKALGFGSAIYGVAVPVCLIFEGSIDNAGSTIDAAETANERIYGMIQGAAHQQEAGDAVPGAIEGLGGKAGNIEGSVPQLRGNGGIVDSTAAISPLAQPQSSSMGGYTLMNALLEKIHVGTNASAFNTAAEGGCKYVTDIKAGVALTALELVVAVFTGGGSKAAETAAEQGVKEVVEVGAEQIAKQTFREALKEAAAEAGGGLAGTKAATAYILKHPIQLAAAGGKFITKTGIYTGATLGATELAKMATVKRSNIENSGLATDATLADQADMGGFQYAYQTGRQLLAAAPMTATDYAAAKVSDMEYVRDQTSRESVSERYFALSNPSSLVSRAGYMFSSFFSGSGLARNVTSYFTNIFSHAPSALFGSLLTGHSYAIAANVSGAGDYNIVPWGWTNDELSLVDQDATYSPIENNLILDKSDKKDEIEKKYGKCFTDSIGTLLSSGDIVREEDGKIKNDPNALCSPINLGINNPHYGDLVFRWRLAKRNDNTLNQLTGMQDPQPDPDSATTPVGGGTIDPNLPSGTNDELISQIKATGNVRFEGGASLDGVKNTMLAVFLRLAQKYKMSVSSTVRPGCGPICPHSNGAAIDIDGVNGGILTSYSDWSEALQQFENDAANLLPKGSWMGFPNDTYKSKTLEIATPRGITGGIDKGTGPHFHLNVPMDAP